MKPDGSGFAYGSFGRVVTSSDAGNRQNLPGGSGVRRAPEAETTLVRFSPVAVGRVKFEGPPQDYAADNAELSRVASSAGSWRGKNFRFSTRQNESVVTY